MKMLIGKKIGMTQVVDDTTGKLTPVTVIDVSNNVVCKVITDEKSSLIEIGKDKKSSGTKADIGNYKEIGYVPAFKTSVRVESISDDLKLNTELKADVFNANDIIDVSGVTKGKGFSGVMKRHGFRGGSKSHGASDRERAPGSIGAGTTQGRVFKGHKMAGRAGRDNVTIKNLRIMHVDNENGLIAVSGAIPGNKDAYVVVKESFFNTIKK